jgi:hypothetical protein
MKVAEEAIWQNVLICKIERKRVKLLAFCTTLKLKVLSGEMDPAEIRLVR